MYSKMKKKSGGKMKSRGNKMMKSVGTGMNKMGKSAGVTSRGNTMMNSFKPYKGATGTFEYV